MMRTGKHGVGGGCVALCIGVGTVGACGRVEQPIEFNHKVHIAQEIACDTCHEHATKAEYSGLPRTEVCAVCHDAAEAGTPALKKLGEYATEKTDVPWQRVYVLPDHVFYSHRRHVVSAGIECATCHGPIATLDEPPPRPLVKHTMGWCLDCHQRRGATTDCIHCHR